MIQENPGFIWTEELNWEGRETLSSKVDNDRIQTLKPSVMQFKANLSFPNYSWKKFQIYIWLSVFIYQAPCPQQIAFLNNKIWGINWRLSLIQLKFLGKMVKVMQAGWIKKKSWICSGAWGQHEVRVKAMTESCCTLWERGKEKEKKTGHLILL